MEKNHIKRILVQWILPFLILIVTVFIMMLNFSVTSRDKEMEEVENILIATTEKYATRVKSEMDDLLNSSTTMALFMENYTKWEVEKAKNLTRALQESMDSYASFICNAEGEGIAHTGERYSIADSSYFDAITQNDEEFIFAKAEGLMEEDCFVVIRHMKKNNEIKGYLLCYYQVSNFQNLIKKIEFDTEGYYAIVTSNGEKLCEAGSTNALFAENDFWGHLSENSNNSKNVSAAIVRMQNKLSGIMYIEGKNPEKVVAYAPVGINDWYMVIGINRTYVDQLLSREWRSTQNMIGKLIFAILLFLVLLIIISIIFKIRDDNKEFALMNKVEKDPLTDLLNKDATERSIKQHLEKHPEEKALLFVVDVDNFKKINDTMGHAFGDEVLRTLGHQLSAEFRTSDIVGRTGGDEFMVFLKDIRNEESIQKEAEKIERFFRNFQAGEYVKYSATASVGAALFPKDAKNFEGLYKAADKALYVAKKRGKSQLAFYQKAE